MSKNPSFYLEVPDNQGESRNKNHEVLVREWLCALLISQRLTRHESALLGYLVEQSRGLRYEITKTQSEISEAVGIEKRNLRKALQSLEEKGLFLSFRGRSRRGAINTYYIAMLWPEEFGEEVLLCKAKFPKLWEKVTAVFALYVVEGKINPNLVHSTRRLRGKNNPQVEGKNNPQVEGKNNPQLDALSPNSTGCDAVPSSFYSFFYSFFMDAMAQKIKSKTARQNIEKGIEKLCRRYTPDVVHERISLIYADKGISAVKPNFHQFLEQNLAWYETNSSTELKKERRRELEKMASQLFLPVHEGLVKAFKIDAPERPIFAPHIEQSIRVIKLDLQKQYDILRTGQNPAYLRAIENEFINRFMMHYGK